MRLMWPHPANGIIQFPSRNTTSATHVPTNTFITHRTVIFRNDLAIYKRNQALIHSRLIEVRGHDHLKNCIPSIRMKGMITDSRSTHA
jgi:hypothetical protein